MKKNLKDKFANLFYLLFSLSIFVVMFIAGLKYGKALPNEKISDEYHFIISTIMVIGWLILYWLQLIIHESGHLIFGLVGGYSFSSFRIGSLFISKENGKIKLSRLKIAGTGGQCLLALPEDENKPTNPILYLLGGGLLNLITALIALPFAIFLRNVHLKYLLFMFFFFGLITALTNLVPANLKYICNDGYNISILAKKDTRSLEAFNFQLKTSSELTKGISLKEMPNDWFTLPPKEDLIDFLVTTKAYICIIRELEKGNFKWVYDTIDGLLSLDVPLLGVYKTLLTGELLYTGMVLNLLPIEQAVNINASLEKDYKALKNSISMLRINYSAELMLNKNKKNATKILAIFNKISAVHPYKSESITENKLIELTNNVYSGKPINESIENFKIN